MSLRLTAATALLVAAFAAFCWVLVPATPAPAAPAPVEVAAIEVPTVEVSPFLAALVPSSDLSPEQAADLTEAGHLVCEGITAEVPVATMTTTLMDLYSLSGEEARHLVNTASATLCR